MANDAVTRSKERLIVDAFTDDCAPPLPPWITRVQIASPTKDRFYGVVFTLTRGNICVAVTTEVRGHRPPMERVSIPVRINDSPHIIRERIIHILQPIFESRHTASTLPAGS